MVFPADFDLTSLNGQNGFVVNGIAHSDNSGSSVSGAGDVNADGIADIIIGAPDAQDDAGQSYVIFGQKTGFNSPLSLSSLNGSNGFIINGIYGGISSGGDQSGSSVSGIGDVNADGIDDIIIGALTPMLYNAFYSGVSYGVFGQKTGFNSTFPLNDLYSGAGFITAANRDEKSSTSATGAGDFNADGIADIIINAPQIGQSYILFGREGFDSSFSLSSLNGTNGGFIINAIQPGSGVGDVNADGIDDIIIGGSSVIFGQQNAFNSPFSLSSLNGTNGFTIEGFNVDDTLSGKLVGGAGDVNADGIDDIIISGYVIFGRKESFNSTFSLSSLNGINGFSIIISQEGYSIRSISSAGDVNADGIDDIIMGGYTYEGPGQSYVIFGQKEGFNATLSLSSLNGTNGFTINGINSGDLSGSSVSGAGDVNADGIADIIIGAPDAQYYAGQSYVIFGQGSSMLDGDLAV
jgi:hypothetical protein